MRSGGCRPCRRATATWCGWRAAASRGAVKAESRGAPRDAVHDRNALNSGRGGKRVNSGLSGHWRAQTRFNNFNAQAAQQIQLRKFFLARVIEG